MSRKTLSAPAKGVSPAPAAKADAADAQAVGAYRTALEAVLFTVTAEGVTAEQAIGVARRIARKALGEGAKS